MATDNNFVYYHKGEPIEFRPDDEEWSWGTFRSKSFKGMKAIIDREMPKRWKETEAYDFGYTFDRSGEIDRVTVVAPTTDGAFWTTKVKRSGRREKSHKKLFEISPHNDECIERLQQLRQQAQQIQEQMAVIFSEELRPLTPEHLKPAEPVDAKVVVR